MPARTGSESRGIRVIHRIDVSRDGIFQQYNSACLSLQFGLNMAITSIGHHEKQPNFTVHFAATDFRASHLGDNVANKLAMHFPALPCVSPATAKVKRSCMKVRRMREASPTFASKLKVVTSFAPDLLTLCLTHGCTCALLCLEQVEGPSSTLQQFCLPAIAYIVLDRELDIPSNRQPSQLGGQSSLDASQRCRFTVLAPWIPAIVWTFCS